MITQYGVLAYKMADDGDPRFLLITSRSTKRWVIPRGNPIRRLSPWQSAVQEAYEEAGVSGYVSPEEIGTYHYEKWRRKRPNDHAEVHVFPLCVTEQSSHFPERHQRTRRWFTREEAIEAVDEDSLKSLIRDFVPPPVSTGGVLTEKASIAWPGTIATAAAGSALAAIWLAMFLLGGAGSSFDPPLLAEFYAGGNSMLANIAWAVTQLGGWIILSILSATFALWLVFNGQRRRALYFLAIVVSGRLLVDAQKILSARDRPEQEHLATVHTLSFPSGHSANSAITYFAMALLLAPLIRKKRTRRLLLVLAALMTVAVGLTRMILGVHWPSDVVGGWAFGLLWTFALVRFAERPGTGSRLLH